MTPERLAETDPARAIQRFTERLDAEDTATFNELIRMARWAAEQERDAAQATLLATYRALAAIINKALPDDLDADIRDAMDLLWLAMTDEQRAELSKGGESHAS